MISQVDRTRSVADPGGGNGVKGAHAPWSCNLVIKKMAVKGGNIDFMFHAPPGRWIRY